MKSYFAICLMGLSIFSGHAGAEKSLPFRDTSLPLEKRLDDLIGRLSLEEKAILVNHKGPTLERLRIRSDQWNQCLNGVKWDRPTTLFPTCIAMSATWDKSLVREIADTLSDEARAIYNGWHLDPQAPGEHKGLIYRAPVINIERNPYWGRNHEAWGEDPFLTGRMAVAYVQGLQGNDPKHLKLAATLKHYAVNNVETDRHTLDAKVSERMLREYWLPHFKDAVVEGKAESLMASYNAINGQPNTINHWLLTDLLKTEWQHAGFVVSDLGGVEKMVEGHGAGKMTYVDAVAHGVMAGCDFSDLEYQKHIPAAVHEGKLTMERLDDALRRVLRSRMKLGEFDPFESVIYSKISPAVVNSEKHRAVALKAAQQSIVLLKNTGLLPLDRAAIKRIAVIGPLAEAVLTNNYNGKHIDCVTALAGIRNRAGTGVEVVTAKGCEVGEAVRAKKIPAQVDKESGFSGGAGWKIQTSGIDQFVEFTVPNDNPGPYEVTLFYKSGPNRGILQMSHEGDSVGAAINQYSPVSEYGKSASLGVVKLQTAGPKKVRFTVVGKGTSSSGFTASFDKIALVAKSGARVETEFESLNPSTGEIQRGDDIAAAAALSQGCDVAIVCIGTDRTIEQEGRDRKTLGLNGIRTSPV